MSALAKVRQYFNPSVSPMDYVAELAATKYTPDIWKIEQYSHQLVFVFDHLKKDHPNNRLLEGGILRWPGYTLANFHLWEGGKPWENQYIPTKVTVDIPRFPPAAKIRGEIWKIPSTQLLRLDSHYLNTVEFERQRRKIIVPTRKVVFVKDQSLDPDFGVQEVFNRSGYTGSSMKHTIERVALVNTWMYIGKSSFWDPLISSYDGYKAVESFEAKQRRWLPRYYHIRRPIIKS